MLLCIFVPIMMPDLVSCLDCLPSEVLPDWYIQGAKNVYTHNVYYCNISQMSEVTGTLLQALLTVQTTTITNIGNN